LKAFISDAFFRHAIYTVPSKRLDIFKETLISSKALHGKTIINLESSTIQFEIKLYTVLNLNNLSVYFAK